MKHDLAPHLAGRMLPGLFSPMPFAKKPRFAGDPWATQPYSPTWFWMHTGECGTPGSYCARPVVRQAFPADLWLEETCATTSPGVGPMGARQPADAGPRQGALFA